MSDLADIILYCKDAFSEEQKSLLKEIEGVERIKEVKENEIQVFYDPSKVESHTLVDRLKSADTGCKEIREIGM